MMHAVFRRLTPLLALVAIAFPAVGFSQSTPNRAGMVVQFGDGRIQTACISFSEAEINGVDLLDRADIDYTAQATGMGAAMCEIEGEGCDYPAQDCFCQCKGAPCVFWRLYNAQGTTWQLAGVGASSTKIRNGDVQAWVWGGGTFTQGEAPEGIAPADVCPVPTAAPPNATAQPTSRPSATSAPARPAVPTPRSPATRTALPPTATRPPTAVPRTPTQRPRPSATAQPRPAATQPPTPTAVPPTSTSIPTSRPNPTATVRVVPPSATVRVVLPTATVRVVPPTAVPVVPTVLPPTPTDALNAAALPSVVPFASASAVEASTVSTEETPSPTPEPSPSPTTVLLPPTAVPTAPVVPSATPALIAGGEEAAPPDATPNERSLPLDPLVFVGACAVLLAVILKLRRRQRVD